MGHHAKGRENVDGTDRQDHLKTGCDRNEETQTLVLQVSEVMSTGGFVKKKTANNDPAAVAYLPSEAVSPTGTLAFMPPGRDKSPDIHISHTSRRSPSEQRSCSGPFDSWTSRNVLFCTELHSPFDHNKSKSMTHPKIC
ncbi:hypothetical protein Tsp_11039 [Trichinella spiralis]|uniref:hypothetical protein n=1 Tax=Trichinella spiralis TaxID=6334 RepID=UPI0001EFB990|nr:hypothetical protein Tsp_11039 [Trichinella spiralis]